MKIDLKPRRRPRVWPAVLKQLSMVMVFTLALLALVAALVLAIVSALAGTR